MQKHVWQTRLPFKISTTCSKHPRPICKPRGKNSTAAWPKRTRRAAEADRRAAEADRSMEELRRIVANASREVGRWGDRWGTRLWRIWWSQRYCVCFQERGIEISRTVSAGKVNPS